MALSSVSSASMEWEEARAEFFQETYPCDRSVSDSIGALTNASASNTGRRTVLESGTGSRHGGGRTSIGGGGLISTLESRTSRASRHSNNVANKTPPTASTTPADAISPTTEVRETVPNHNHLVQTQHQDGGQGLMFLNHNTAATASASSIDNLARAPSTSRTETSDTRRGGGRNTKARMRAAVQGLEEEDSEEGEIEVVDFTDGIILRLPIGDI